MRITDLQVDGFGVWKGLSIESLDENVTVFFGQNEAGKTTLMQFIRSMMFGFSAERQEKYVPPIYGGLAGGSAEVVCPLGSFEIQRHVDPNRLTDPVGDLAVTDTHEGSVHGRGQLANILSDIDESIFNNVFAIGLREIQELGALNSTDASDMLYKLTSGLDRVSLVDVMRDLKSRRESIFADTERSSQLGDLYQRQRELLREIEELKTRSKRWTRIAAQSNDISHELEELSAKLGKYERESRLLEIAMQVVERWQSRNLLTEQIKAFGKLPDPKDLSVKRLDQLNNKIASQRERMDQIKEQRRHIKKEAMSLPINRQLWAQKARIDALAEHSPWVESLQRQANHLRSEIDLMENSLVGEVDGLGDQLKIRTKDVLDLGNRGMGSLKSSGRKLTEHQDRLKRLRDEVESTEFDLGQHSDRLGKNAGDSLPDSVDDTTRHVNRLRRRIELEEKINKLQQSRHDLEREIDDIVNDQVLPVGKLAIVGVIFVLGIVFVGFGIIDTLAGGSYLGDAANQLGILMMLLGTVCGFVAMGIKYHWERVARDELDDFRHQMEVIRQQLKRSKQERDELDRQLPDSLGQWELELSDAEAALNRMEELVPLENRVRKTRASLDELRRRVANQEREVEVADKQWRGALRTAGLPEILEPHQLKEIAQRTQRIAGHHVRLDQFRSELADREKELNTIRGRIDTLLHDCGLEYESQNIIQRLGQLSTALHEQRALVNSRKELATKYKSLRNRLNKCKLEYDKLVGQKRRLLTTVGADTEDEYRNFELQHHQRNDLVAKRLNLTEQIAAALGNHFVEEDIQEHLDAYGQTGLAKRMETVEFEIEELKEQQTKLHQQKGEFLQEIKMLGEDSRLDEAKLELNSVEAEVAEAKKHWQVLAASSQMLESIREKYESKRQPETLQEASSYLERLTEGKYRRIWTRLVGEELLVDNAQDETITVEKLSRGTREAVYLSLRLALIGAYARRGAVLPMVLDDVLVNFDTQRARAAAELLCDFSRNGYQLLMFTCHEHMRDLFHSLNARVKVLPHHRDVLESQAVPSDYRGQLASSETPVQREPAAIPYVAPPPLELQADDYDPELEYELSAVVDDQQKDQRLRHELIYISPNHDAPIDLSGNEDIWNEGSRFRAESA